MKKQSMEQSVCCYILKGEKPFFADERIKWHFLKKVGEICGRQNWAIYAFCLTDYEAYFIVEAYQPEQVLHDLYAAVDYVSGEFTADIYGCRFCENDSLQSRLEYLHSLKEIAECCRRIHCLPLWQGYAGCLNDYWWSSYSTYVGGHEWEFMNSRIVLLYFSAEYEEAVWKFRYFHKVKKQPDSLVYKE